MRSLVTWQSEKWPKIGVPKPFSLVVLAMLLSPSPSFGAVDYDVILRDRLFDVRELLDRRQAHRSMLTDKIERFSDHLDQLQVEREAALDVLSDQKDRARAHERELDRLMPRLLPRLDVLNRVRKGGARAMAGLAQMERSQEIEEKTRSRLMATQAKSIEQMRRASTAVRLLRRIPNAMTARHRDVDFQIPLLAASASRLEMKQSQLQRRRDAAVRELADLTVDIDRLTAEEHRLARNIIARRLEATDGADTTRDRFKTALPDRRGLGKAKTRRAEVRGLVLLQTQPTPMARPLTALRADGGLAAAMTGEAQDVALSVKSQSSATLTGRTNREPSWSANVASLEATSTTADLAARVSPGRIDRGQALMPTIESIGYTLADDGLTSDRPEIQIAARPNQRVAAPDDGRVAFAGDFRSYGLLLIIEHGNGYHTLLWGFSSLDIEFGDHVRAGQIVGAVKDGPSPKLHVELRRNGQPVSPEVWLAASNSGVKG